MLYQLPLRDRLTLLPRMVKGGFPSRILAGLDPLTLSSLNPGSYEGSLRNMILLGKSLMESIRYFVTGDTARLDYSRFLLGKIDPGTLDYRLKPIYESLLAGDVRGAVTFYSRKHLFDVVETIGHIVWEKYSHGIKPGFNEIKRALELGYMVLRQYAGATGIPTGKYHHTCLRGRLDTRATMRNMVRGQYVIVNRRRQRKPRNILLLDTSGSMLRYSLQAVIMVARFMPSIKYTVIFSDRIEIVNIGNTSIRRLLTGFLAEVYTRGFRGYTDIAGALRAAANIGRGKCKLILVSDLKQTVPKGDPLKEAEKIISMGGKLAVVIPPGSDTNLASMLERLGAETYTFQEAVRSLRRIIAS
jgi:hypothetical protein